MIDEVDAILLTELQRDATQPYTALAAAAGLSTAATHDRVRKLRDRGIVRRTTVELDPAAVGLPVLAFVLVRSDTWVGDPPTREALAAIPEIEEAHIVAGAASLLVKIRTAGTVELQDVLRRLYAVGGTTETIVVLETFFERPVHISRP